MDPDKPDNEKAAVFTHNERPRPARELFLDLLYGERFLDPSVPFTARTDAKWEEKTGMRVDFLDKDNIITDHPEKYDLEPADPTVDLIQPLILPIPDSLVATMFKTERVTPEGHWQDVRRLGFRVSARANEVEKLPCLGPGSTIVLYPKNASRDVQTLIDLMAWGDVADLTGIFAKAPEQSAPAGYKPRPIFRARRIHHPDEFPTLRSLLVHNFDINAIPKRDFLSQLQRYTEDPLEKERLAGLVHSAEEFYDSVPRPRRTIIEVLQDFRGVKIPYRDVISLFPLIRGREYNIANSTRSQTEKGVDLHVEVLAALVEYKTVFRKPRLGLCSRYLKHLHPGTFMQVCFKRVLATTKKTETDVVRYSEGVEPLLLDKYRFRRPVIAVATGTGIAPFRVLLQDRLAAVHGSEGSMAFMGPNLLFYGCRSEHADFHFGHEWRAHAARGELEFHTAFSRDPVPVGSALAKDLDPYIEQPNGRYPHVAVRGESTLDIYKPVPPCIGMDSQGNPIYKKPRAVLPPIDSLSSDLAVFDYDRGRNYVQHHIRRHAKRVAELLQQRPLVMICGGPGRMSTSVWAALRDVLVLADMAETRKEAQEWLEDEENITFWEETW